MELLRYGDEVIQDCKRQATSHIVSLQAELKGRLEWSESDLLRSVLVLAGSQSWQCITRIKDDDDDAKLVKSMKLYMVSLANSVCLLRQKA